MKGSQFVTIGSLLLAVGSVAYSAGRTAQAPAVSSQPVQVTNTTSQCVPTSIYHSIALPAVQSGPWNVGSIGDKLPFQRFMSPSFTGGQVSTSDQFTVPSGKRLVIDNIAAQSTASQPGNGVVTAIVVVSSANYGSVYAQADVPLIAGGIPGTTAGNQPTHIIAEAGQVVVVYLYRSSAATTDTVGATYTLSGHYVVVP